MKVITRLENCVAYIVDNGGKLSDEEPSNLAHDIRAAIKDIKQLQAQLATAEKQEKKLAEFARQVIRGVCWGSDDGCDVQGLAERLGLLVLHMATSEDVDGEVGDHGVGDTIYKFSDMLKEMP